MTKQIWNILLLVLFLAIGCQSTLSPESAVNNGSEIPAAEKLGANQRHVAHSGKRRSAIQVDLDRETARPMDARYDQAFLSAVQAKWYQLLDDQEFVPGEKGKVVVEFRLQADGRITDVEVVESEVSEELAGIARQVITGLSPWKRLPTHIKEDLIRRENRDYREVRFTFYHHR